MRRCFRGRWRYAVSSLVFGITFVATQIFFAAGNTQAASPEEKLYRLIDASEGGRHRDVLVLSDEIMQVVRPTSRGNVQSLAIVRMRRGLAFLRLGQFDEAEDNFSTSLELLDLLPEDTTPQRNIIKSNQAMLLIERGEFRKAVHAYKNLLAQKNVGIGERILLSNNLTGALLNLGKVSEAEILAQRVLSEIPDKPQTDGTLALSQPHILLTAQAATLGNLAEIARYHGELDEAKRLYQRSLEIRRKVWGPNHPDLAISLNGLAVVAVSQGDYEQALIDYQSALDVLRPLPLSPLSLSITANIADIARTFGDHQRAISLLEGVLNDLDKYFPDTFSTSDNLLHNLGLAYLQAGKPNRAEEILLSALQIRQKLYLDDHPFVLSTSAAIGWSYLYQGRPEDALYMASHLENQLAKVSNQTSLAIDVNAESNAFHGDANMLVLESAWAVLHR